MSDSATSGRELIARAVIIQNGALLVNRGYNKRLQQSYFALPGGHVDPGESCPAALLRELQEELEAEAEVGALCFVSEQIYGGRKKEDGPRHELVLFFETKLLTDLSASKLSSPEASKRFQWLPLDDVAAANLVPPALKARLSHLDFNPIPAYAFEDLTLR
jgi:ADP-ribose pyrophosphatase YjhB (NUDIX family)